MATSDPNTTLDPNTTKVSGPVNVVRMEGKINNIQKVIYIFMDMHYPLYQQLECNDIFSKTISQYFAENFLKLNGSNITYDFFLEIFPTDLQNISFGQNLATEVNNIDIYLQEIRKLFRKIFQYEPKENKVSMSQVFQNVRLHYMDIRDYFKKDFQIMNILTELGMITWNMWKYFFVNTKDLEYMINQVKHIKEYCQSIVGLIEPSTIKVPVIKYKSTPDEQSNSNNKTTSGKTTSNASNMEQVIYLLSKIFNKYKNQKVKETLSVQKSVIIDNMQKLIMECSTIVDFLVKVSDMNLNEINRLIRETDKVGRIVSYQYSNITIRNIITQISNHIDTLSDMFVHYFTRFMDIFFLRRFLDKDYITHAITYTGAYHSMVYIQILAQEFNFKITNTSYAKYSDLAELNAVVQKTDADNMAIIFYPSIRSQCSDMETFPKNFL